MRNLLHHVDADHYTCAEIRAITVDHLAEVRRKISDLRGLERALKEMIATCEGGDVPGCPIVETLYA